MSPEMLRKITELSLEDKTQDDEYRNGQIDLAKEILADLIPKDLPDEPTF